MRPTLGLVAAATALTGLSVATVAAQRGGVFRGSRDHPAIQYSSGPVDNAVSRLNRRIRDGAVALTFDGIWGYLPSVLEALDIPVESQVTVFSKTSFQADSISLQNPRAIYFADEVAIAKVPGTKILEVAVQDRRQGSIFYTLEQTRADTPQFTRSDGCLACHLSWDTLGVPGLQVLSTFPMSADPNAYATGFVSDHRSRIEDRWGGWYVTGKEGTFSHMGNVPVTDVEDPLATIGQVRPALASLEGQFDLTEYLSPYSDIVALMALEHQTHMANLITRIGWEARRTAYPNEMTVAPVSAVANDPDGTELLREAAVEVVDYLLFVDEAPLPARIEGSSGFAERLAELGPHDDQGRSLREFDLEKRLLRYPCSYMIYADAFDALPPIAKDLVYQRLWQVLSGQGQNEVYSRLALADRQAIVEILRATKADLPTYFQPVTR